MKFLPILTFLLFFSFLFPLSAYADYQSAYSDYTYNYTVYRNTYNDYQVSKSTFLTYHTLTSQSDAIDKLRAVLKARDMVMFGYYNLLQEKLNSTPGVTGDFKSTFGKVKDSEQGWLTDHQKKVDASASLDDLNSASADFEGRYPQMDTETKQAIGSILLAKESTIASQIDTFITNLQSKTAEIRQSGQDTTFADRGVIDTKNKLDLFQTKLTAGHDIFFPPNGNASKIDIFVGQQQFTQANQYLREAVGFLTEIIKSFTG